MHFFSTNLRHLRKQQDISQEKLATALGIKRSTLGAYELGSAEPNIATLQKMAGYFEVGIDKLIDVDLENNPGLLEENLAADIEGRHVRILPITVADDNEENIELVPEKVSAGYLTGYSDPEFIATLSRFRLPLLPQGTYRAFQIKGDSMLPVLPGSIIIAEYITNWRDIKNDKTYIIVHQQEGIVFKRVFNFINERGTLQLVSDNPDYEPFQVRIEDVLEVWQLRAVISLESPAAPNVLNELTTMVRQLQQDVDNLKQQGK